MPLKLSRIFRPPHSVLGNLEQAFTCKGFSAIWNLTSSHRVSASLVDGGTSMEPGGQENAQARRPAERQADRKMASGPQPHFGTRGRRGLGSAGAPYAE